MSKGFITLEGKDELFTFLNKKKDIDKKKLDVVLQDMAFSVQNISVKSINRGSRTGRVYTRRSVAHVASAAGEPPKTDTGQLVRNITVDKKNVLNYDVGSRAKGAPYGFWLEMGTRNIAPRPWLKPAYDETIKKFRGFFK